MGWTLLPAPGRDAPAPRPGCPQARDPKHPEVCGEGARGKSRATTCEMDEKGSRRGGEKAASWRGRQPRCTEALILNRKGWAMLR